MTTLLRQWRDWVHPKWPFVLVVLSTVMMALSLIASVDAQRNSAAAADNAQRTARQSQQTADDTHSALCALKEDYRNRVEQSEKFLEEHPNGFAGVSAEVIRSSLDNYRRTLRVFGRLDC